MRVGQRLLIAIAVAVWAAPSAGDDRTRLPSFFENSYIRLTGGVGTFGFTDANLAPNLHSTGILNDRATFGVSAGHYFKPWLALQIGLLRPVLWVEYRGVLGPGSSSSVRPTILALTARPELALSDRFRVYGEVGAAYIARIGFNGPGGTPAVSSGVLLTPLTGGGVLYTWNAHWHVDATAIVTWANHRANEPSIRYGALGLVYLFGPSASRLGASAGGYDWPLNLLEGGFFQRRLFYWDATRVVSTSSVPLFFAGQIKARSGYTLIYERNVFHTTRWFSLNWGLSAGRWASAVRGESFYTLSVFPAIRLWPVHSSFVDSYIAYSLAGPAYLSRVVIDGKDTGGRFTFQDYIGIGVLLGTGKHLDVDFKLLHYSNGNLLTHNPGVAPPLTANIGYAW
jgi:hypothetical protein